MANIQNCKAILKFKKALFIVIVNIIAFGTFAQDFEGYYTGKLLTDNNLLVIDKDKRGNIFVELHSSERDALRIDGVISDNCLKFLLPTFDGDDIKFASRKTDEGLLLSFNVSGEDYTIEFKKINLPKRNAVAVFFKEDNSLKNLDPDLIGEWRIIGPFDAEGNLIKESEFEFHKKSYVSTFLKDGTVHEDPRFFWDLDKKHGTTYNFRPNDIPKGNWSTSQKQTLKLSIGGYEAERNYEISNDTLKIISPNGNMMIYVKRK